MDPQYRNRVHRRLSDFVPFVECESLNVEAVPGAIPHDYAAAFLALLDAGFVCAYPVDTELGEEDQAKMDRSAVEEILEKRLQLPQVTSKIRVRKDQPRPLSKSSVPDLRWRITALGGDAWEKLAEPDWNRFEVALTDFESGDIWSANYDLLMADLGWCRELSGVEVDRDTVRVDVMYNHPITYWKVQPLAYHATFSCTPVAKRWPNRNDWEQPRWFHDWWKSLSEWYKKPWELSGWPTIGE